MVFEEKQGMMRHWWIILPLLLPTIIISLAGMKADDAAKAEIFASLWTIVWVDALILFLFNMMRLYSRIDGNGVSFRYVPFIRQRSYNWNDIEKVWVRKYKPITEFGGWGIKSINRAKKGIAYNVWGNKGLQLELKNGKKILIGTQKADEMAAFLKRLKEKYNIEQIDAPQLNG
jgi:hypothetical protein